MAHSGIVSLASLGALVVALSMLPAQEARDKSTNLGNHKILADGVTKSAKVILHEGLPHQTFERALLEKELKDKKTVKLHDFPFYAEPLTLKEEDVKALTKLIGNRASFEAFRGEKLCGGFHPDYGIEWQDGKETYRVLVCFGCQEVKCFTSKHEMRWDVNKEAHEALGKILKPYRKNRPEPTIK